MGATDCQLVRADAVATPGRAWRTISAPGGRRVVWGIRTTREGLPGPANSPPDEIARPSPRGMSYSTSRVRLTREQLCPTTRPVPRPTVTAAPAGARPGPGRITVSPT